MSDRIVDGERPRQQVLSVRRGNRDFKIPPVGFESERGGRGIDPCASGIIPFVARLFNPPV
jgi:hypothetical protein